MGSKTALRRARISAVGVVIGALVVAGLVSIGGGAATADAPPSLPPLLPRDGNVVTSDPIPTVQIDNGYVWAQTIIGSTVYAVGKFDNAREPKAAPGTALTARSNVLAYDIETGRLLPFAPKVNGVIKAVAASPDGGRIYIGGSFTSVNGTARFNFAALDAATGELVPGFVPSIGGTGVYALAASGTTVFVGGLFTQANGTARKNLAAFTASNGALLPWTPQTDLQVDAMVSDPAGTDLIVGGRFSQISGNTALRGIGAVDKSTGAVDTAWQVPNTVKNGVGTGPSAGKSGIFGLTADATGIYGTGWAYASAGIANLEGAFAAEAGTGRIRWIADCLGDHYGVYSTGKVVYTTSHTHACSTMGLHPEQSPRTHRYSEAFTADARGTLGAQPATPQYFDWKGTPAPSPYAWTPDWAVGTTTGLGQAGLSITGTGTMISIGGEFRSVNNGQFEGLVRFSTAPPGGAKDRPRLSGDGWVGTAIQTAGAPGRVTVSIPANWDRDDLTLTYELHRAGTAEPIASATTAATWWNRPLITLVDPAAPAGGQQQYSITAKDGSGNTATSAAVTVTTLPTGQTAIVARHSGKAVGVSGTATPVVQQATTDAAAQRWTLIPKSGGTFQVRNEATGRCLAVSGQSQADSAKVLQWTCSDEPHLLWSLKSAGGGFTQLLASHSAKCLTVAGGSTVDGAELVQMNCATAPATASQFSLRTAGPVTIVARHSAKDVGISGSAAQVVQQTDSGSSSQRWTVIPKPDGRVQLKNAATGLCLAVAGQSQAESAKVYQWACAEQPHFLWTAQESGGFTQLIASHSGKCLTVAGGSVADGAELVQAACMTTPTTASQFTLRAQR